MNDKSGAQRDLLREHPRRLALAVADHVRREPSLISRALTRVREQLEIEAESATRESLEAWSVLLTAATATTEGRETLEDILTDDGEGATELRASSPFVELLTDAECHQIHADATDLGRLQRAARRRASWTGATGLLRQKGSPDEPLTPNRPSDRSPVDVVRETLLSHPTMIGLVARETRLTDATVRAWLEHDIDHLTSGAALAITGWSYRLLDREFPPRILGMPFDLHALP